MAVEWFAIIVSLLAVIYLYFHAKKSESQRAEPVPAFKKSPNKVKLKHKKLNSPLPPLPSTLSSSYPAISQIEEMPSLPLKSTRKHSHLRTLVLSQVILNKPKSFDLDHERI